MNNAELNFMTFFDGVYFISSHLKKINKNYSLAYHHKLRCYVIYDTLANQIVITFPNYPTYEIIYKLLKTRKENFSSIINEINSQNEKTQNNAINNAISTSKSQIEEIFNYANKKPSNDLSSNTIKNIIGEKLWQKKF